MLQQFSTELAFQLGGSPNWNEISAYDATRMAANAYFHGGIHASTDTLFSTFFRPGRTDSIGLGGFYLFDQNQDQTDSYYAFYSVRQTISGANWVLSATYSDVYGARDTLTNIEE